LTTIETIPARAVVLVIRRSRNWAMKDSSSLREERRSSSPRGSSSSEGAPSWAAPSDEPVPDSGGLDEIVGLEPRTWEG
jgi:hypothetical protein